MEAVTPSEVSKHLAGKLREETGVPLMECKKALFLHDGDFEKAKIFLQSPAWLSAKLVTRRYESYYK